MEKPAIFGLFAEDKASQVFKHLGQVAKKSASETATLSASVDKASLRAVKASENQKASLAKLKIAQASYGEMMLKNNVSQSASLASQERMRVAWNSSEKATIELAASTNALSVAEAKATLGADRAGSSAHHMGSLFKTAAIGAVSVGAFALFKFGKESLAAAASFQTSQVKLQTAIKDSGHSWDQYAKPVAALNTKMEALGFTSIETQDALAVMTTGLKDPTKAISLMSLAADVARYKNISLSDSALLLTKAQEGQLKAVKALGIDSGVAASGVLKIKTTNDALIKAEIHLAQVRAGKSGSSKSQIAHDNAQIKAQTHLATLQNKYGNNVTKTIAQTNALEKAQARANKTQAVNATGSFAVVNAEAAVTKARLAHNDALKAGDVIIQTVSDRLKGQAANAADTYAVKLKILSAGFDNMKIAAGNELMGPLTTLTTWAAGPGLKALKDIGTWTHDHGKEIELIFAGIGGAMVGAKIGETFTALATGFKVIKGAMVALIPTELEEGAALDVATGGASAASSALGLIGMVAAMAALGYSMSSKKPLSTSTLMKKILAPPTLRLDPSQPTFMSPAGTSASKIGKPLTAAHSAPTIVVHQHIAGSVVTEKKLVDTVHAGIAQKMILKGKDPKAIGK